MKENQKAEIKEIEKKQIMMEKKGEQMNAICQQISNKQAQLDTRYVVLNCMLQLFLSRCFKI